MRRFFIVLAVALMSAFTLVASAAQAVTSGSWSAASTMNDARYFHTATLLHDGRVLVAEGIGAADESNTEIYSPANDTWSRAANMSTPRPEFAAATPLADGRVLVVGGRYLSQALASAEVYDPASNRWTTTPDMATARFYHTATLLPNGKVLVVGGASSFGVVGPQPMAAAELYDPALNTWTAAASMSQPRIGHTASLLANGDVLVAGGIVGNDGSTLVFTNTTELYHPLSNSWSSAGSMTTTRSDHKAVSLMNGDVFVVGGSGGPDVSTLSSAETYSPSTDTWSPAGNMSVARVEHTATLLANGDVLVAGGYSDLRSAEVWGASTRTWSSVPDMSTPREAHTATLLFNGKVLVSGGVTGITTLSSAELFDPGSTGAITAHIFQDFNHDGVQEGLEPNLAGWTLSLFAGSSCAGAVLSTDGTDASGNATFPNLSPGTYSLSETVPPGWTNTSPTCGPATVTSNATTTATFGNADVALLAPVASGIGLTIVHGYNDPPWAQPPARSCNIGTPLDHCRNQQFGLDLQPNPITWNKTIITPTPGTPLSFFPANPHRPGFGWCLLLELDDASTLDICHFVGGSFPTNLLGQHVPRGAVLGKSLTGWIHVSIDDRPQPAHAGSFCTGGWLQPTAYYRPIAFVAPRTFENTPLPSDGAQGADGCATSTGTRNEWNTKLFVSTNQLIGN